MTGRPLVDGRPSTVDGPDRRPATHFGGEEPSALRFRAWPFSRGGEGYGSHGRRSAVDGRPSAIVLCAVFLAGSLAHAERVPTSATTAVVLDDRDEVPSFGPADAPVEVELFCALGEASCRQSYEVLRQLSRRHAARLRVLVRVVPPPGPQGQLLAEAAFEANRQGMFFPYLESLARGSRDPEAAGARAGLDISSLRAALEDHRHARRVERDVGRRDGLGLLASSSLLWNGAPQVPAYRLDTFERAFDEALARAKAALAAGIPADQLQIALARESARERRRRDRGGGRVALDLASRRASVPLEGAPLRGEGVDVTVVMFADFECPFCRRQVEVLRRLEGLFPGRVRVAFKHFPLPFHANARLAAEAAVCAQRQGKFWPLHDALFRSNQPLTRDTIDRLAQTAKIDTVRLWTDVQSGACAARVRADLEEGRAAGVEATPTLLVNGLRIPGTRTLPELRAIVGEELSPGWLAELTDP